MNYVVILGAGVTGLTAAWELSKLYRGRVVLLEKAPAVGGLAATFSRGDLSFDLGSHRLHEGHDPAVDSLIKDLCGDDLLRRPRRGVIYLKGRALPYPPSTLDILFAFGPANAFRFLRDFVLARLRRLSCFREPDSFEDFTTCRVGKSLYERFYKPYAQKLYGISPKKIARDPAVSRVRKFTFSSLYQDLKKKLGKQRPDYLYPARGIGQLSDTLQKRFQAKGGRLLFISRIDRIKVWEDRIVEAIDFTTAEGKAVSLPTELVVSTIPLGTLHHLVELESDQYGRPVFDLRWRGLRLLYLITPDKVPSEHETFYFPEPHIPFGRVSEVSKYSPGLNREPSRAVLTIESPCSFNDETWNMPDDRLAALCVQELQRLGILRTPSSGADEFFSRRIRDVYPVYDLGWRERFNKVFQRLNALDNLYLIGRTALFLHCNIDHCMSMALRLVRHLAGQGGGKRGWEAIQQGFFNYRVHE
jgi:protoporphyrinogen oxidase